MLCPPQSGEVFHVSSSQCLVIKALLLLADHPAPLLKVTAVTAESTERSTSLMPQRPALTELGIFLQIHLPQLFELRHWILH